MRHVEREDGHGAEQRDTVLRMVVFAFVSLAAWWCCSNVASADDATPATAAPDDRPSAPAPASASPPAAVDGAPAFAAASAPPVAPAAGSAGGDEGTGLAAVVEMLQTAAEAPGTATQGVRAATEPAAQASAAEGPVVVSDPPEAFEEQSGLMAGVVLPLVAAVEPALAPVGEVVDPVVEAVTTPLAPLVQTVVPVVDQVAGPVLGPVVTPLVAVVAPVVEQASSAVAPVVELVAPVLVPVAKPVVGLVAPVVGQLAAAVVEPVVAAVRPAVRSVLDLESRVLGLRPATTAFAREAGGGAATASWALLSGGDVTTTEVVPGHRGTVRSSVADSPATVARDGAVLGSAAPAAPSSPGAPFRPTSPAQPAVVVAHGGTDTSQRTQRLVAVLSPAEGVPAARLSALSRTPAVSPLARFGGRPPVTPD